MPLDRKAYMREYHKTHPQKKYSEKTPEQKARILELQRLRTAGNPAVAARRRERWKLRSEKQKEQRRAYEVAVREKENERRKVKHVERKNDPAYIAHKRELYAARYARHRDTIVAKQYFYKKGQMPPPLLVAIRKLMLKIKREIKNAKSK